MRTDRIAILLATYNGEKYLKEQLDSIIKQSCNYWELFVHDDGSTDSTCVILQSYLERYPDRIHIIEGPATGSAKNNFFFLMNSVDAPYVMFSDQDDIWHPNKIEKTFAEMQSTEQELDSDVPILVFSELRVVDENLNTICPTLSEYQKLDCSRTSLNKLLLQNVVTGCTVMINRSLLNFARTSDTDGIIMHDWWCALIASKFGVLSFFEEPLIDYRQHQGNSIGALNVNSPEYVKSRLSHGDKIKKDLLDTRTQAARLAQSFDDELANEYSNLESKSKLSRWVFYAKSDMWKNGFARNLALLMFE